MISLACSVAALLGSSNAVAQTALTGSELILPASAPSNADIMIIKTASNSGANSFSIVIGNAGPVAVTGAVVTDTGGTSGFCTKSNTVTITGGGVPEGSFTISNLSGSGIALGTLQPGQSATITYACQGQ